MRLLIRLEPRTPVPPFEQVRAQIALMVAAGRLRPRQRLPPIRELAEQLSLANGTVARAYRELERAGIIETRGRAGTFVAAEPPVAFDVRERHEALHRAAQAFARDVRQLDLDVDVALESVRDALAHELDESIADT